MSTITIAATTAMSFPALRSPISAARSVTEGLRSLRAPVSGLNVTDATPVVDAVNAHSPDDSATEEDSELKLPKLSSLISMLVLNGMSHASTPFYISYGLPLTFLILS